MSIFDRFHRRGTQEDDARARNGLTFVPELVHWLDTTPVESRDKPCTVSSLEVTAHVNGIYARVRQTIQIANPNYRPISTQLTVPLPDRAVICGYALDIDGQMVEGVVVPKEEARVIFETEQRRQADPGLAEAVRGNVYSTRVYPVPAHGTRTVELTYMAPLLLTSGDSATLELSMPSEHLDRRTMAISVERLDGPSPQISGLADAVVRQAAYDWHVETEERDLTPSESVRIELPALPETFTLLERDREGTTWFCVSSRQEMPNGQTAPELRALTVLWDVSGSRADQDHTAETELLRAYASGPAIGSLTLVAFADRVRDVSTFTTATDLVEAVEALRYDGGTDFGELSRTLETLEGARAGIDNGAACVLFTDGLDTLSLGTFSLPEGCSCLSIVSGGQRDAEALRQGCRGPVLDLSQAPRTAGALATLLVGASRFGMADLAGQGVADVYDVSAPDGSRRAVIGRITRDDATLRMGKGDEPIILSAANARRADLLSPAWAARRITLLSTRPEENAAELLELGRSYGMASPATSLLVLETLDQWLRYDIEPPASLTEMHDAWREAMRGRMRLGSKAQRRRAHLFNLEREWRDVMDWWERDYPATLERDPLSRLSRTEDVAFGGAMFEDALPTSASHEPMMAMADAAPRACVADSYEAADSTGFVGLRRAIFSTSDEPEEPAIPSMNVKVRAWKPDTPYLKALDRADAKAGKVSARDAYFAQRSSYRTSPSFFLDCAGWFIAHEDAEFGIGVLTNLAELRIEDAGLLRVMAWRLREAGMLEMALVALRRVLRLRGEDSQSHRDVALVASEIAREAYAHGDKAEAARYALEAARVYRETALTPWNRRPMAIALFAVEEYNVLKAWVEARRWDEPLEIDYLSDKLTGVPDCDLRITLAWDADETDVDIHVTEPSGEEAYYAHRLTSSGGHVSEDITDGYGPELYEIRHARPGVYNIRAHYFASHQQTVFGPATCTLTVYSDWGRPNQTQTITSMRLDREREMIPVGTASYGNAHEPTDEDAPGSSLSHAPIELGMSPSEVAAALGVSEPPQQDGNGRLRVWTSGSGSTYIGFFEDGRLVRLLERMSWGDERLMLS